MLLDSQMSSLPPQKNFEPLHLKTDTAEDDTVSDDQSLHKALLEQQ